MTDENKEVAKTLELPLNITEATLLRARISDLFEAYTGDKNKALDLLERWERGVYAASQRGGLTLEGIADLSVEDALVGWRLGHAPTCVGIDHPRVDRLTVHAHPALHEIESGGKLAPIGSEHLEGLLSEAIHAIPERRALDVYKQRRVSAIDDLRALCDPRNSAIRQT